MPFVANCVCIEFYCWDFTLWSQCRYRHRWWKCAWVEIFRQSWKKCQSLAVFLRTTGVTQGCIYYGHSVFLSYLTTYWENCWNMRVCTICLSVLFYLDCFFKKHFVAQLQDRSYRRIKFTLQPKNSRQIAIRSPEHPCCYCIPSLLARKVCLYSGNLILTGQDCKHH